MGTMIDELRRLVTYCLSSGGGASLPEGDGGCGPFDITGAWVANGALLGGASSDLEGAGGDDGSDGGRGRSRTRQLIGGLSPLRSQYRSEPNSPVATIGALAKSGSGTVVSRWLSRHSLSKTFLRVSPPTGKPNHHPPITPHKPTSTLTKARPYHI